MQRLGRPPARCSSTDSNLPRICNARVRFVARLLFGVAFRFRAMFGFQHRATVSGRPQLHRARRSLADERGPHPESAVCKMKSAKILKKRSTRRWLRSAFGGRTCTSRLADHPCRKNLRSKSIYNTTKTTSCPTARRCCHKKDEVKPFVKIRSVARCGRNRASSAHRALPQEVLRPRRWQRPHQIERLTAQDIRRSQRATLSQQQNNKLPVRLRGIYQYKRRCGSESWHCGDVT